MNRFLLLLALASTVSGATYYYVDWKVGNPATGVASGKITLPDASTVDVTFESKTPTGGPGTFNFINTNNVGTNYWNPPGNAPYVSASVSNGPPTADMISLYGGTNNVYVVTLSEPIKDPIMALVSVGDPSNAITYDFDSPFSIVSQGAGHFGNGPLSKLPGDVLKGKEGHGTIRFNGVFSTFSWTVPTEEKWHGFTFGIRTTERVIVTTCPPRVPAGATCSAGGIMLAGDCVSGVRQDSVPLDARFTMGGSVAQVAPPVALENVPDFMSVAYFSNQAVIPTGTVFTLHCESGAACEFYVTLYHCPPCNAAAVSQMKKALLDAQYSGSSCAPRIVSGAAKHNTVAFHMTVAPGASLALPATSGPMNTHVMGIFLACKEPHPCSRPQGPSTLQANCAVSPGCLQ